MAWSSESPSAGPSSTSFGIASEPKIGTFEGARSLGAWMSPGSCAPIPRLGVEIEVGTRGVEAPGRPPRIWSPAPGESPNGCIPAPGDAPSREFEPPTFRKVGESIVGPWAEADRQRPPSIKADTIPGRD